jgi:PAS domain S-box-containing protein
LLSTFVKHVPAAVAMLDRQMRYLQVSDRWSSDYALGSAELLGHSHYEIFPGIPEHWKEVYARCLAGETLRSDEDRWQDPNGNMNWLRWEIRPWGNQDGLPEGILIFSEDISERKRGDEMLKESEATTRALLETAAQAILVVDANGNIVLANRMTGEMFGYDPGELLGCRREILMPERPKVEGMDPLGRRKDGAEFPIEVSLSSVPTTRGALSVSFISDITMRRQAEMALRHSEQQLRELAGNLLTAHEDERRRVARELHDDVTQTLAFLSIELGRLAGDLPDTIAAKRDRVRRLQEQTLRASQEVRRLSHGLHPSVIEDFGLSVALEEFCEEFEKAQGVSIRFDGLGEDARLNHAAAACLYRVAQESLRNAVQHGQANEICVELKAGAESIRLCVRDNGKGFSDPLVPSKGGLGMISMRERMRLVNGTLTISSIPEHGTEVAASAPLT